MTRITEGSDIKAMVKAVAIVMVVSSGGIAAFNTTQSQWAGHFATLDLGMYGIASAGLVWVRQPIIPEIVPHVLSILSLPTGIVFASRLTALPVSFTFSLAVLFALICSITAVAFCMRSCQFRVRLAPDGHVTRLAEALRFMFSFPITAFADDSYHERIIP